MPLLCYTPLVCKKLNDQDGKTMESERYYPFEHKTEKRPETNAHETRDASSSASLGKGRRGGNAAASIVVHSGKTSERAESYARRHSEENKAYGEKKKFSHDRRDDLKHDDRRDFHRTAAASADAGKHVTLTVIENTEYGSFLKLSEEKKVLLPFAEMTRRPSVGDEIAVTLYEDKGNRLTATMRTPILKEGETGVLNVAAVTKIGVFVDNGMPKQVLVPFRELLHTPEVGDEVLIYLYNDKSGREAGTMRVYRHLLRDSGYEEGDRVEGFVYEINEDLGVFVAVDNKYYGLIPKAEYFGNLRYGDRVEARVSKVRSDGKMDLLMREKLYTTANSDANLILEELKKRDGMLPYADRADAEEIKETFSMSKNQFKRALGYLYKKRLIEIDRDNDSVRLIIQFRGADK